MDYDKAVEFILSVEGYGDVKLSHDPGGLTIWGISGKSFPQDVSRMSTMDEVTSKEYAKAFYLKNFWKPSNCDSLPWPLNLVIFDTSVNCGIHRVSEFMVDDWKAFLCNRVRWQLYTSKSIYTVGLLNRIYNLYMAASEEVK